MRGNVISGWEEGTKSVREGEMEMVRGGSGMRSSDERKLVANVI